MNQNLMHKNKRKRSIPRHISTICAPYRRSLLHDAKEYLSKWIADNCRKFILDTINYLNREYENKLATNGHFEAQDAVLGYAMSDTYIDDWKKFDKKARRTLNKLIKEIMNVYIHELHGPAIFVQKYKIARQQSWAKRFVAIKKHVGQAVLKAVKNQEWPIKDLLDSKYPYKPDA